MQTVLWSIGILLLIACLILQVGWWDRGKLMQQPQVRAAVDAFCGRIGCRPEPPRLAGTLQIQGQALTERPEIPGRLRLSLVLVNKAAVSQGLPQLQLEFYDENGELAAARRFEPENYLADADLGHWLDPGATIRAMLDLEQPLTPAAGFRVKLF